MFLHLIKNLNRAKKFSLDFCLYLLCYVRDVTKDIIKNLFLKKSTIRKRWNYIKLLWNLSVCKKITLNHYPTILIMEPGPICNLNCYLCPEGQKRPGRTRSFLGKEVVECVLEELGSYLNSVILYCWGEPLLNENLFELIRLIKEKASVVVEISSNLNIFNDHICKEIVDSGIDRFLISLHGGSQKSLDQYQVGSNFDRVISNMKKLVNYKKSKGVKHPTIIWDYLVNRFNEHEIKTAYHLSKEIGVDKFSPRKLYCDVGKMVLMNPEEQYKDVEPFLPKDQKWSRYDYIKRRKKKFSRFCTWLYTTITINSNGSVSPCCSVWEEKYDFDNILETSFKKIWNGKKFQLARQIMKSKKPINIPWMICSICKNNEAILS